MEASTSASRRPSLPRLDTTATTPPMPARAATLQQPQRPLPIAPEIKPIAGPSRLPMTTRTPRPLPQVPPPASAVPGPGPSSALLSPSFSRNRSGKRRNTTNTGTGRAQIQFDAGSSTWVIKAPITPTTSPPGSAPPTRRRGARPPPSSGPRSAGATPAFHSRSRSDLKSHQVSSSNALGAMMANAKGKGKAKEPSTTETQPFSALYTSTSPPLPPAPTPLIINRARVGSVGALSMPATMGRPASKSVSATSSMPTLPPSRSRPTSPLTLSYAPTPTQSPKIKSFRSEPSSPVLRTQNSRFHVRNPGDASSSDEEQKKRLPAARPPLPSIPRTHMATESPLSVLTTSTPASTYSFSSPGSAVGLGRRKDTRDSAVTAATSPDETPPDLVGEGEHEHPQDELWMLDFDDGGDSPAATKKRHSSLQFQQQQKQKYQHPFPLERTLSSPEEEEPIPVDQIIPTFTSDNSNSNSATESSEDDDYEEDSVEYAYYPYRKMRYDLDPQLPHVVLDKTSSGSDNDVEVEVFVDDEYSPDVEPLQVEDPFASFSQESSSSEVQLLPPSDRGRESNGGTPTSITDKRKSLSPIRYARRNSRVFYLDDDDDLEEMKFAPNPTAHLHSPDSYSPNDPIGLGLGVMGQRERSETFGSESTTTAVTPTMRGGPTRSLAFGPTEERRVLRRSASVDTLDQLTIEQQLKPNRYVETHPQIALLPESSIAAFPIPSRSNTTKTRKERGMSLPRTKKKLISPSLSAFTKQQVQHMSAPPQAKDKKKGERYESWVEKGLETRSATGHEKFEAWMMTR